MLWNPNPSNSIIFRAGAMALLFDEDPDFPGDFQVCVVLARPSPAVDWNTVQNGTIMGGRWADDVSSAGGWDPWIKREIDQINAVVRAHLGDPSPAAPVVSVPPGVPTTVAEWKAWMLANVWILDGPTGSTALLGAKPVDPPQPTPTPTPGNGKPGNGWLQFTAGQQDMAFRTFVDKDGVQRFAIYRKDGPGQFVWVPPATTEP